MYLLEKKQTIIIKWNYEVFFIFFKFFINMKYEYPYLSLKVILMKQITYPVLVFYIEFENITRIL